MVVPLKLVTFNAYLVARQFNQNRITHPEQRAARMQDFLRQFDLCFLQEVWGSGFAQLTVPSLAMTEIGQADRPSMQNLTSFSLPESRTPFLGRWVTGTLAEFFYTLYFHLILPTGGLYDMALPSVATCIYRSKHTFTVSRSKSRKGVEATLWKNIAAWDDRYNLLVFNTHLDPWVVENRRAQVQEIVQFMVDTVEAIDKQTEQQKDCWSRIGVLVVGDFNVKAMETKEYTDLFVSRGWKDFLADADRSGNGNSMQTYDLKNSLVCYPEDCGRIDYVFGIDQLYDDKVHVSYQFLPLRCKTGRILRQPYGQELSDHYPILVELLPDL